MKGQVMHFKDVPVGRVFKVELAKVRKHELHLTRDAVVEAEHGRKVYFALEPTGRYNNIVVGDDGRSYTKVDSAISYDNTHERDAIFMGSDLVRVL